MADLKPCPFCGSEEVHTTRTIIDNLPANIKVADIFVMCEGCGAAGRSETTAEKAIESWNRRYEDSLTFCYDCRWFDAGMCNLHKIKVRTNYYCFGAWRRHDLLERD